MPGIIPNETKCFIAEYIDNIVELEALLFLREHRDRRWSSPDMAERLYTTEEEMGQVLAKLRNHGFIVVEHSSPREFRYHPTTMELSRSVDQLAEVYAKYLVPVTNLVHQKARRNLEGFADAFKFKKED